MRLGERIGVDLGRRLPLEEGIVWAAANGVRWIDAQCDLAPNAHESFDAARCAHIRELCADHRVHLGLHTLSAVNVAEVSPFLRDAADRYLDSYIDLGARLGAEWIVVHAGYHFTADLDLRLRAAVERLGRASARAEAKGQTLLLENMNREPERAEVRYLGHSIEECRILFEHLTSPALGWSFTINHATLMPEGIDGFLDRLPFHRCREVRLADSNGQYELHMQPGTGMVDWGELLAKTEGRGFAGHYMCAFGDLEAMLEGRAYILERAREAGVASA
jgi:sugar phosphate isomerase/epimerase